MRVLVPRPLEQEAYAPFGAVLEGSRDPAGSRPANQGTARKWPHRAPLDNARGTKASPNLSVFRCAPRTERPVVVRLLERHPHSAQVFVPLGVRRYLIVVAHGIETPDLSTATAFLGRGHQGISYHPTTWHSPMIALDEESDFVSFVWEDGTPEDCTEAPLNDHDALEIRLPESTLLGARDNA